MESNSDNIQLFEHQNTNSEVITDLKLQYYTYFLNPINQIHIPTTKLETKGSIISKILSKKLDIGSVLNGEKKQLHYIPINISGDYIYGKIYRKGKILINKLDEGDIHKDMIEDFPYVHVFINTSDDKNKGQKIALQYKNKVFSNNNSVLKRFADFLSIELEQYGYVMNINPITCKNHFWNIINNNSNIEKVTLQLAVPNLFGSKGALEKELKSANENFNATNVNFEFENKGGNLRVMKEDPFFNSSVSYMEKGGGEYTIKLKGMKTQIKSSENTKTKTIKELEITGKNLDLSTIFNID